MNSELLSIAKEVAIKAGLAIMDVFVSEDFATEYKADDSPVTKADKTANDIINSVLESTGLPVLSEENIQIPFSGRQSFTKYWLVDPLDGTKSFVRREPDFTVNIALIENDTPVLGVVYVPATQKLYWGSVGGGAFIKEAGVQKQIHVSETAEPLRVVASKNHLDDATARFIEQFRNPDIKNIGSSLKILAIAEGTADIYPRLRPSCMEWDTAAAHAVLEAAGGDINDLENKPLSYNKEDLLNPGFIATNNLKSFKI